LLDVTTHSRHAISNNTTHTIQSTIQLLVDPENDAIAYGSTGIGGLGRGLCSANLRPEVVVDLERRRPGKGNWGFATDWIL
jgi:hypothetical protein